MMNRRKKEREEKGKNEQAKEKCVCVEPRFRVDDTL